MRIQTCVCSLEVPEAILDSVDRLVARVLSTVMLQGCGRIVYFPSCCFSTEASMELVSTTLLYNFDLALSLVKSLDPKSGEISLGYTAEALSPTIDFVLALTRDSITKITTSSCIAVRTIRGWVACCDDPKHVSRALRRELKVVRSHLLAESPGIEEEFRNLVASASDIEALFRAVVSYPSVALAVGALLPIYLPPNQIRVELKELDGHALARACSPKLSVAIDPSVACGESVEELGRTFIEVAIHEYLHIALHANTLPGRGAWLLGKPVGVERIVAELAKNIASTIPTNIVLEVGRKVRELVPIDRCERDRVERAIYTDLTHVVLAKNLDLVEEYLMYD
ncbi:MAG: hypothetical protein GXO32_03545 [Crenarchaeota archaeon]|nr:hypothetical protein [Thermoproteota archaeon]